jgi:cytochrome b561
MLQDSRKGYGIVTIAIHWISAVSIVFLFGLGIYMVDLSYYDEWYHKSPALHISIGLLLFFLMVMRISWRLSNPTPEDLSQKKHLNITAKIVKWALYLLIFSVLITGYLITTAEGKPAEIFNWFSIPAAYQLDATGVDFVGEIHEYLAWAIILVALMHAGGALMHHFVFKDRTLMRMLKPVKKNEN